MTTTSSFRSCSLFECVLLMAISLSRNLRGESLEDLSKHAVERGKRVDDVGKRLERGPELDSQHELAKDLAGTGRNERRTDQHAALCSGEPGWAPRGPVGTGAGGHQQSVGANRGA